MSDVKSLDVGHFVHVLWSFTRSDIKKIVAPSTLFALVVTTSRHIFGGDLRSTSDLVFRMPLVILNVWSLLLFFDVSNQRQPSSIKEDRINKTWRPLPRKLISTDAANLLQYMLFLFVPLLAYTLGSLSPCIALIILTWMHNDLKFGDTSFIWRNLLNGLGYTSFNLGAAFVAAPDSDFRKVVTWSCLLGCIIASSVHAQDLEDHDGDAVNDRVTIPLMFGDTTARLSIGVAMIFWSALCPLYLGLSWQGCAIPLATAALACWSLVVDCGFKASKRPWRTYLLWFMSVLCLPLLAPGKLMV